MAKEMWRCPACGREFKNRSQWHSCLRLSIDDHFRKRPGVLREVYDRLIRELEAVGPVRADAVKGSINLASGARFAAIYPCRDFLKIEFYLDRPLFGTRCYRIMQLSKSRFCHSVNVDCTTDLDEELIGWLKSACELMRGR